MDSLLIVGTPLTIGIVASGLAELLKRAPYLSFIRPGKPWTIRATLAIVCVLLQAIFNYANGVAMSVDVLTQAAIDYYAASVAYTHLFKAIARKGAPVSE